MHARIIEHANECGCHSCFIETCSKIEIPTKDTLVNAIRNFIRYKSKATTDIKCLESGCMCINHLIQYKEKHIQILDKLLESLQGKDPLNKSIKETTKQPKEFNQLKK